MDYKFIEQFYEKVILYQYGNPDFSSITWTGHDITNDSYSNHRFTDSVGNHYLLIFQDYPIEDYWPSGENYAQVSTKDKNTVDFSGGPMFKYIPHISGYFTLFITNNLNGWHSVLIFYNVHML